MSKKGFLKLEILIVVLAILISILGIAFIRHISYREAEKRALQRAEHLKMLKMEVEKYKAIHGVYPSTGFDSSTLEQRKGWLKAYTYSGERWNECDRPNNWIPGLSINLPHDPANSCKNKESPFPRYEYISDGKDYKILSYKLVGEICEKEEFRELIDPARPCTDFEASWAVYSPGAEEW